MEEFHIGLQIPTEHMQNIFGNYDSYIRQIEDDLQVVITDRNGSDTGTECVLCIGTVERGRRRLHS